MLISLPSFAFTKFYDCKTFVDGVELNLYIEQETDDFFRPIEIHPPVYKSKVVVKATNLEYEFDIKSFSPNSEHSLQFEMKKSPLKIPGTQFKLVEIFLYDKYEGMERDDFFFGRLENTKEGKDHYVSNFSNFGGDLMHIFTCNRY